MKPPPLLEALEENANPSEEAKSDNDRVEVRATNLEYQHHND